MRRDFKIVSLVLFIGIALASCKKYENGGLMSRAHKNIQKAWKIDSYYLDGVDNTSNLVISNFVETFNEDGGYLRTYTDESGDAISQSGSWTLDDAKSLINVSGTGSYELTAATSTVSTSDYTLLKLKKKEMWYSFSNGGSTHEFHLVPQ